MGEKRETHENVEVLWGADEDPNQTALALLREVEADRANSVVTIRRDPDGKLHLGYSDCDMAAMCEAVQFLSLKVGFMLAHVHEVTPEED